MIRVKVVSPNPAIRIGLREMLTSSPDIDVVSEGASITEASMDDETEVVILASVSVDSWVKDLDNLPAVLLLTDNEQSIRAFISAKVKTWGVLSPAVTQEELISAVHALGEGLVVGSAHWMRSLFLPRDKVGWTNGEALPDPLTTRESEVLELMAQGLANKQIAVALKISEHTVKFHLSSLYAKLNVSSRTEAVRAGLGLGLISL